MDYISIERYINKIKKDINNYDRVLPSTIVWNMLVECGYPMETYNESNDLYISTLISMKKNKSLPIIYPEQILTKVIKKNLSKIISYENPYLKFVKALYKICDLDLGRLATDFVDLGYPDIAILILRLNDMSVNNIERFDI